MNRNGAICCCFVWFVIGLILGIVLALPPRVKDCESGYHHFDKWADVESHSYQLRHCQNCGLSEYRAP